MSDNGNFLARWSARKREASREAEDDAKRGEDAGTRAPASSSESAQQEKETPHDPASLPPLDSISAASDVRAFLAAGVPTDLTRAALRRAWTTDHAIRDFVGLAENAWDFNAPGGIAGFGALKAEDIAKLLAQATGGKAETDAKPASVENVAPHTDESGSQTVPIDAQPAFDVQCEIPHCDAGEADAAAPSGGSQSAEKPSASHDDAAVHHARPRARRHGGALPES